MKIGLCNHPLTVEYYRVGEHLATEKGSEVIEPTKDSIILKCEAAVGHNGPHVLFLRGAPTAMEDK